MALDSPNGVSADGLPSDPPPADRVTAILAEAGGVGESVAGGHPCPSPRKKGMARKPATRKPSKQRVGAKKPEKIADPPSPPERPYTLDVSARPDGKGGYYKAAIELRPEGGTPFRDRANMDDGAEVRKAALRLAKKAKVDANKLEINLSVKWGEVFEQKRAEEARQPEAAEDGSGQDIPVPCSPGSPCSYQVDMGRICRKRTPPGDGQPYFDPLCNFSATITREEVLDDGSGELRHTFAVEGKLATGESLPGVSVPAGDFGAMNWPLKEWGLNAVVFAGQGVKDHLRVALLEMSRGADRCRTYLHTGWRQEGGAWLYLHAGGAIGPGGAVSSLRVELAGKLANYLLPDPPTGATLVNAIRADLRLLGLGPTRLAYPLHGAAYRAALGPADFSLSVIGRSGLGKSEYCSLEQSHYGAGMHRLNLPGNWTSTANALESLAFLAKDALLVIDDFKPGGSRSEVDAWHAKAERVLRAQGNASGRGRCWADGRPRAEKPPRGLILLSGEDLPRGESLRARNLALQVSDKDFDVCDLTPYQQDAAAGLYASSFAGFIRWLSLQYDAVRSRLPDQYAALRSEALDAEKHPRTPGIVADLALGLGYFLDYALAQGAITEDEREGYKEVGWQALLEAAGKQAQEIQAQNPARRFLDLLISAIASGRAHIAGRNGNVPTDPIAWGWEEMTSGTGGFQRTDWRPRGRLLGWLDGSDLFLDPEGSYAEAQQYADAQGDRLPLTQLQLYRRLKDQKMLASWETEKTTTRRKLQGRERKVLHLHTQTLSPLEKTGGTGGTGGEL